MFSILGSYHRICVGLVRWSSINARHNGRMCCLLVVPKTGCHSVNTFHMEKNLTNRETIN